MLEVTTEQVIDWISSFGNSFIRINGEDFYNNKSVTIEIDNGGEKIDLKKEIESFKTKQLMDVEFSICWYRRWSDNFAFNNLDQFVISNNKFDSIIRVLRTEEITIKNFFLRNINVKKWLTSPNNSNVNKLTVLKHAKEIGINIPDTIICTEKIEIEKFLLKHKEIITKPLNVGISYHEEEDVVYNYTEKIKFKDIKDIPDVFFPTLFQKMIKKKYEIRSFYLDGNFYSMCIFSQLDKQTNTDFRIYNKEKPNRLVPYKLPLQVEKKLKRLMKTLNLNTGSIDIVKGKDNKYYFLEVNPVGQFGMTSYPCNYYLEKKVAEYLVKNDLN